MKFKDYILESLLLVYLFSVYSCSEERYAFREKIPLSSNVAGTSEKNSAITKPSVHSEYFLTKIPDAIVQSDPEANLNKPVLIKPFSFFVKEENVKPVAKYDKVEKKKKLINNDGTKYEPKKKSNVGQRLVIEFFLSFSFLFGIAVLESTKNNLIGIIALLTFPLSLSCGLLFIADIISLLIFSLKNSNKQKEDKSVTPMKSQKVSKTESLSTTPLLIMGIISVILGLIFLFEAGSYKSQGHGDSGPIGYILVSLLFFITSIFLLSIYSIRKSKNVDLINESSMNKEEYSNKAERKRVHLVTKIGLLLMFLIALFFFLK